MRPIMKIKEIGARLIAPFIEGIRIARVRIDSSQAVFQERIARDRDAALANILMKFCLDHESILAKYAGASHQVLVRGINESDSDLLRLHSQDLRRLDYYINALTDSQITQIRQDQMAKLMAGFADSSRGNDALRRSLMVSRSYWEDTLALPDTTPDLQIKGRRRLTKLNTELEALNSPDNQPE